MYILVHIQSKYAIDKLCLHNSFHLLIVLLKISAQVPSILQLKKESEGKICFITSINKEKKSELLMFTCMDSCTVLLGYKAGDQAFQSPLSGRSPAGNNVPCFPEILPLHSV